MGLKLMVTVTGGVADHAIDGAVVCVPVEANRRLRRDPMLAAGDPITDYGWVVVDGALNLEVVELAPAAISAAELAAVLADVALVLLATVVHCARRRRAAGTRSVIAPRDDGPPGNTVRSQPRTSQGPPRTEAHAGCALRVA